MFEDEQIILDLIALQQGSYRIILIFLELIDVVIENVGFIYYPTIKHSHLEEIVEAQTGCIVVTVEHFGVG